MTSLHSILWLRNWVELAKRAARLAERQPEHAVSATLDLTWLPTEVRPQGPDEAVRPFIVMHVTGVRGGYGVSRQLRNKWQGRLDDRMFVGRMGVTDKLPKSDDKARVLGLWDRYRRTVEYHRLVSHAGQAFALHDLETRTPHAGPYGNDGVGFALDQHPNEPCAGLRALVAVDLLIETGREMIDAGHPGPVPVTAHRCVAPPQARGNDAGAVVWRAVVMPAVAAVPDVLTVDYEFRRGKGLPIPKSWDPRALFDVKGRPAPGRRAP